MTIFYPDLSHYDIDRGVSVEPGTVAVIAKATHGTLFVDSGYATFKAQAAKVGALFGAYHWLNHGNGAAQARYCYQHVGTVPVMVDAEDTDRNSGYNGPLTVQDIVDFVTTLRAAGGICNLVYLPHWYWQDTMKSPSLAPLVRLGVGLVSSNYTTYSDTGPGWTPYGAERAAPVVWQYTDHLPYGGGYSDFNAFRGTVDEFRTVLYGAPPAPTPAPIPRPEEEDMKAPVALVRHEKYPEVFAVALVEDGGKLTEQVVHAAYQGAVNGYNAAGYPTQITTDADEYKRLCAAAGITPSVK